MAAILENFFFHNTIQTYVGVFGSVFDEIKIKRSASKFIKVPIAYSIKKRYDVRNEQNPDPNKARVKNQLPRMSFTMTGMQKDSTRILNRMNNIVQPGDRKLPEGLATQRERVPYNFQFRLDIKTKNIVDMLQIMEQIIVYFNPSIVVTVIDNPDLDLNTAIPIRLLNTSGFADLFEGAFEDEEIIESSLDFELEGYLYMPTTQQKVIKKVTVNYFEMTNNEFLEKQVFTEADLP